MSDTEENKNPAGNEEKNQKETGFHAAPAAGPGDDEPGHGIASEGSFKPQSSSLASVFAKAAGHMALGAGIAMVIKTSFCAAAMSFGFSGIAVAVVGAAVTSALLNAVHQVGQADKAFSLKKVGLSAILGATGSGLFLTFGDTITDAACDYFTSGGNVATVTDPSPAGLAETAPSAGSGMDAQPEETETEQPAEETMTAQEMKDEAFTLFNDGNGVNDAHALDLFNKAAEQGNFGARIDQAYIEHWGLAGTPEDKAASISKMQDVLSDMKEAGRDNTAEFRRGQDLLDRWQGVTAEMAETGVDADKEEAAQITQDILQGEIDAAEGEKITNELLEREESGDIVYEPNSDVVTADNGADTLRAEEYEETDKPEMAEQEIKLTPTAGSVGCENGWVTIDPKGQMYLSCPLNGAEGTLPKPGSIMNITPPATAAPLLGR
ncbi:MAG: hypothetical protein HY370_03940 [Proteobacteria bacterium]|nr:hypothetical protein [Pseudomonadota bacterium]